MRKLLSSIGRFLTELRRRKVYQVGLAYVVVGFFVIEAADLTLVRLGLPPWTVTFVVVVVGLGFPIALVLAWALEVTPEGVRVEESKGSPEGERLASSPRDLWVGASVLALLLVGAWWLLGGVSVEETSKNAGGETQEVEERSIAVLPFEPLSSGEESETFARGVHDDLLTRLSNVGDLQIISRTSVQQYRDTELSLPAIADSLGVRWVVEGGVLESGGEVQVNAQLIDPRSDVHRWAESYERDLTAENLFAVQGEITREIAEALQATLTAGEQERIAGAPTQNLEAYRLYAKGRRLMLSRQPDSLSRAIGRFEQAIEEDSTYALAWSGLADARILQAFHSPTDSARAKEIGAAMSSARVASRRALTLEQDLAEANASRGLLLVLEQQYLTPKAQNGPAVLRHLQRAVDLKPSYAPAHDWLGSLLMQLGRPDQALKHYQLAVELSPENRSARGTLIGALIATGNHEQALREARTLQQTYRRGVDLAREAIALAHLKRWSDLRALLRGRHSEVGESPYESSFLLALADAATGDTVAARGRAEKLRARGKDIDAALIRAVLGEVDGAFTDLPEIEDWGPVWHVVLRYYYPDLLSAFRADPRYEELIREVNEAWGLNPDGSIPDSADVSFPSRSDPDA